MNYYTSQIPLTLAEKLKEKGMPITYSNHPHQIAPDVRGIVMGNFKEIDCPTFGSCFDWLMSRDFTFYIDSVYQERKKIGYSYYLWDSDLEPYYDNGFKTWHEAAEAAIEKALTLI